MSYLKDQIREVVHEFIDREYKHHPGLSTNSAAEWLGIHPQTLRSWVKQGKIKARGVGSFCFDPRDILKYHHEN